MVIHCLSGSWPLAAYGATKSGPVTPAVLLCVVNHCVAVVAPCGRTDTEMTSAGTAGVRFLVRVGLEVMRAVSVVIELVGQDQLVIVAEPVEGAHRVGVVGPTFVAGYVALDRPGRATVE